MTLRWKRVAAEGVVIVASILLAFTIDAWWDGRVEERRGNELTAFLRSDVAETQNYVADQIRISQAITASARAVLESLAGRNDLQGARDSLLATIGSIFVVPDWSPVNNTYQQALGSGDLALIRDLSLRSQLARYSSSLDRVRVVREQAQTQYYAELEPFLVANTVYSEVGAEWWRGRLVQGVFRTDLAALSRSRELWNLLTLKLELEEAALSRLRGVQQLANELLAALSDD